MRLNFRIFTVSLMLIGLFVVPAISLAQEDETLYEDATGRFSVTIPAGWTDESVPGIGMFTHENGTHITVAMIPGVDLETARGQAFSILAPDIEGDPDMTSEIPAPNGVWTQDIFTGDDGALTVFIGQVVDGDSFIMVVQAPDEATLDDALPDVNNTLISYTIGEALDLTGVEPQPLTDDMLADFESYMNEALETFGVVGASVAIVQDGEIIYVGGFGEATVDGGPVDEETLFMLGSVAKSMTSLIMATLVDEGLVDWDQPATDILPEFALSDADATAQIAVRDLLNMSGGVPRYDIPLMLKPFVPEEAIANIADIPLVAQPGETFNYSNYMVTAGGYAAARAAGNDDLAAGYADLLQSRVFDPLEMDSSTLDFEAALADPNHAVPYSVDLLTGDRVMVPFSVERFVLSVTPAGAVWSNADDMANYLLMEVNHGVTPDGTRIVSEENLDVTQRVEVGGMLGYDGYGMGWYIGEYNGLELITHGGNTIGFSADVSFLPEADLGVVVLSNRATAINFTYAVREYVFELAFDLEHTADKRYQAADEQLGNLLMGALADIDMVEVEPEAVSDFVGEYDLGVMIEFNDAGEFVVVSPLIEVPLLAVEGEADRFVSTGVLGGVTARFGENDNGETTVTIGSILDELSGGLPYTLTKVD